MVLVAGFAFGKVTRYFTVCFCIAVLTAEGCKQAAWKNMPPIEIAGKIAVM